MSKIIIGINPQMKTSVPSQPVLLPVILCPFGYSLDDVIALSAFYWFCASSFFSLGDRFNELKVCHPKFGMVWGIFSIEVVNFHLPESHKWIYWNENRSSSVIQTSFREVGFLYTRHMNKLQNRRIEMWNKTKGYLGFVRKLIIHGRGGRSKKVGKLSYVKHSCVT